MRDNITGVLRLNENNRWCIIDPNTRVDLVEITSGDVLEFFENSKWVSTRIEFDGVKNKYYSVAGINLYKDQPAKVSA